MFNQKSPIFYLGTRRLRYHKQSHIICQKSPTLNQNAPIFDEKSCIFHQNQDPFACGMTNRDLSCVKRALQCPNRASCSNKRALYSMKRLVKSIKTRNPSSVVLKTEPYNLSNEVLLVKCRNLLPVGYGITDRAI